jgi:DNA helicase-2/ATP-dependent DNA helicase PcrA
LEAGEMQSQTSESAVHLMTLHAAKGLEFSAVFMVGMEEGVFPGMQSIGEPKRLEEERRLCYVGMTRAKEKLTISHALERRLYGRTERHRPSRFLREIPDTYLDQKRIEARVEMPKFESYKHSQTTDAGFRLGQTVHHAKFGEGVVLAIDGHGDNTRVQVSFSGDSKWLMLAYAKLEAH